MFSETFKKQLSREKHKFFNREVLIGRFQEHTLN